MGLHLVKAPISITYSKVDESNKELFERDYDKAAQTEDDAISQWLMIARARGETSESDPVTLNLLVELHRKLDRLERMLNNETIEQLELAYNENIESIGYEHFKLINAVLESDVLYYGRVTMPLHPKRDIVIFFEMVDANLAKIVKMHAKDVHEWSGYLTARERILIREMKGL